MTPFAIILIVNWPHVTVPFVIEARVLGPFDVTPFAIILSVFWLYVTKPFVTKARVLTLKLQHHLP